MMVVHTSKTSTVPGRRAPPRVCRRPKGWANHDLIAVWRRRLARETPRATWRSMSEVARSPRAGPTDGTSGSPQLERPGRFDRKKLAVGEIRMAHC